MSLVNSPYKYCILDRGKMLRPGPRAGLVRLMVAMSFAGPWAGVARDAQEDRHRPA